MTRRRYLVMGAGEVGFHLAQSLSRDGHEVTVIEIDEVKATRVADLLDANVIHGSGTHRSVLESAGVTDCDLFMAVASSDEANIVAAMLARHLGANRTVVRVGGAEEIITDRRLYEEAFGVDLLLSTQMLTMTRVLNKIRGHNTVAVEYLAEGKVQLRKIHLEAGSPLVRHPLKDIQLPEGSLVAAFFRGDDTIIPSGGDKAEPGDDALILSKTDVISVAERAVTDSPGALGSVVLAGGGLTGRAVARALEPLDVEVKMIEIDRQRAERLASLFPRYEILHGDCTDEALLRAERIGRAATFVALTGHDESNLMACLLARGIGVDQVLALVQRSETSQLWRRLGLQETFSPRQLAYERIHEYIDSGYSANIVSLKHGHALVMERHLAAASPAAGVTLEEMSAPRGLIVGAVVRDRKVFVPRGKDRLEVGDLVILFVRQEEIDTVRLLFPGRDPVKP